MKIEKYIEQLQDLAEKHPNAKIIYNEGDNEYPCYQELAVFPYAGRFYPKEDEFVLEEDFADMSIKSKVNAILLFK